MNKIIKPKITLTKEEHIKIGKSFYDKLCDNALILNWIYYLDSRTLEIEIEEKNLVIVTQQIKKLIGNLS